MALIFQINNEILNNNNNIQKHITYLYTLLRDSTSFINISEFVNTCTEDDIHVYSRLLESIFLNNYNYTEDEMNSFTPFLKVIIRMSLYKILSIRRIIRIQLHSIIERIPNIQIPAATALYEFITAKNAESICSSPYIWSTAIIQLFPIPIVSMLTTVSLIAEHPLCRTKSSSPLLTFDKVYNQWQRRTKRNRLVSATKQDDERKGAPLPTPPAAPVRPVGGLMLGLSSTLVTVIFSSHSGLCSSDDNVVESATNLFISLSRRLPPLAIGHLLPALMKFIDNLPLMTIGPYEIAIYRTADGQLCTYRKDGEYVPVTAETKNIKKDKHSAMYGDDDYTSSKKTNNNKDNKNKQPIIDKETTNKILEQTILRNDLKLNIRYIHKIFNLITLLIKYQITLSHTHMLSPLLKPLHLLMRNILVDTEAIRLHRTLSQCLDVSVRKLGAIVPSVIQGAITRQSTIFDDIISRSMIRQTLNALADLSKQRPFAAPTFYYILPLISLIITTSKSLPDDTQLPTETAKANGGEDDENEEEPSAVDPALVEEAAGLKAGCVHAVAILAHHSDAALHLASITVAARYPTQLILSLLLHTFTNITSERQHAESALMSLAPSLSLDHLQLLLGPLGALSADNDVRQLVIDILSAAQSISAEVRTTEETAEFRLLTYRVWLLSHDTDTDVATEADALWNTLQLELDDDFYTELVGLLSNESTRVRESASLAIAAALKELPEEVETALAALIKLFTESPDSVVATRAGIRGTEQVISRWTTRDGVARTIAAASALFGEESNVERLFQFFLSTGLRDDNVSVWEQVLAAALAMINAHGATHVNTLLPLFEQSMKSHNADDEDELEATRNDRVREGAVVMMGTIARYLPADSPRVITVVNALLEVLKTPSHSVQKAVAECIAPLCEMSIIQQDATPFVRVLLNRLRTSNDFGERYGAAFGIGGLVKGLKLSSLKKYAILQSLNSMVTDASSAPARQGALYAYERLFYELGPKFEPYVAQIVPHLLACAADTSSDVRDAMAAAARMMMSHLSGHGVKMVLPLVLAALSDEKKPSGGQSVSWRSRMESIGLLGAMAYCAPQQLSTALPLIVPRLLDVMTDPNAKVQAASRAALRQIGSVIRNPEIHTLVPVLLQALNDPSTNTKKALTELMRTSFIHSIDPPSLALIVPILRKGLKGRTAPTKKMAAQVVGSLCSLTNDVKDIMPYASMLLKLLKTILIDPIPEVRSVAARAIAALYKGIGSEFADFHNIIPDLLQQLRADSTSVERSGAAAGLAQVLAVEGVDTTRDLLPQLFTETHSNKGHIREAFFILFTFMPEAFGPSFATFVPDTFPIVIQGFSDEIGLVREAAVSAGVALIVNYATSHTELLLKPLEHGLIADDWRIRLSSVQLVGLLLLRLAGLSGKLLISVAAVGEEEDMKEANVVSTREQEMQIEDLVGRDRRNRIFALIYIMRSDQVSAVKEIAWRAWKGVVLNTPRTLNMILPTLMNQIISDLASTNEERQAASSSALGELVQKMGESVLTSIVPILQSLLDSEDDNTRQGVCLGLSEVLRSARKADLSAYIADVIPSIRDALCDESALVRAAAGKAFLTLYKQVGRRAIDEIVPALIAQLDEMSSDPSEVALVLEGMKEILSIVNAEVLPYIIPALAAPPLTLFHAKAMAALADQFGRGFSRYVQNITTALIDAIVRYSNEGDEKKAEMRAAAEKIILSVSSDIVHVLIDTLVNPLNEMKAVPVRLAAVQLIGAFCSATTLNYDSLVPLLLQAVIKLLNDPNDALQIEAWEALDKILQVVTDERASKHISFVREVIANIVNDPNVIADTTRPVLPGLSVRKGPAPLLPMFQHALMHGTNQARVEAATGLGEIIELSSEKSLAPHVIKITGPLIRIVGDRFPAEVKAAILHTLHLLIMKNGAALKPFVPQLQTTFMKSISDPSSVAVRTNGSRGLAELMATSRKVDPVITELCTLASNENNPPVRTSILEAINGVIVNADIATKLLPETLNKALTVAESMISDEADTVRRSSARCIGLLSKYAPQQNMNQLIQRILAQDQSDTEWKKVDGALLTLAFITRLHSSSFETVGQTRIIDFCVQHLRNDNVTVVCNAIVALGEVLTQSASKVTEDSTHESTVTSILTHLSSLITANIAIIREETCMIIQRYAQSASDISIINLDLLIIPLLSRATDANGPARRASQGALYYLLRFHRGADIAEKLINSYGAKLKKRDETAVIALMTYAKKTILKIKVSPAKDPLSDEIVDPNGISAESADDTTLMDE